MIASRTSTDNSNWSAWAILDTLTLAASSGSYNPSVSSTPGTYTQFGVWTIDALNVYSGEKISNSIYCNITACGAPTALSVNKTIAEGYVTLSWSGASGGAGNAITGYEIQSSDSYDLVTWGSWTALSSIGASTGSSAILVSPPNDRGCYRRFRVRTKGAAGASYYSGWKVSTNTVRKNILPIPPSVFNASPLVYESGIITLSWSGAVAGTSAIKQYVIQQATSTDNTSWSDWATLKTITSSATSGTTTATPPSTWKFLRFRISVTDTLSAVSAYTVSNTVKKNIPPLPVLIEAPKNGSFAYNKTPRILIETQAEPDGLQQTVFVTATDGNTYNSVDNPGMFSSGGSSATAIKTVFTNPQTAPGTYSVSVLCKDEISSGTAVSRYFTIAEPNFETITANETHVKARHITDLRTAVNNVRDYFNLPAYSWDYEIIPGRTNAAYWVYHVIELRAAIQGVLDKINMYDTSAGARIPEISWLPLGTGRPRADVMEQLATAIRNL